MRDVDVTTKQGKFQQTVKIGPHTLVGDEPTELGGDDAGPAPHDFLLTALGTCTSMTIRVYAEKKGWKVDHVHVHLTMEKIEGGGTSIRRKIEFRGDLDDEKRARLLEIAGKCPVHKTLTGKLELHIEGAP